MLSVGHKLLFESQKTLDIFWFRIGSIHLLLSHLKQLKQNDYATGRRFKRVGQGHGIYAGYQHFAGDYPYLLVLLPVRSGIEIQYKRNR